MGYKTILVHLNDPKRAEAILAPAVTLARRHGAHLIGLHVYPGVPLAPASEVAFNEEIIRSQRARERKEAEALEATFSRMTKSEPVTAEWRAIEATHLNVADLMVAQARGADLVVAGQIDPDWDRSWLLDMPERLAIQSGRPVLTIPYIGRYSDVGRNVMVAWKPSREATRAVFDALPILGQAAKVDILRIAERSKGDGLDADAGIAAALGRHGIKPTLRRSVAADLSVGDEILSRLADQGADLLVMGAYGHSRLNEFLFGGATRHIARHMTVPTLFSH